MPKPIDRRRLGSASESATALSRLIDTPCLAELVSQLRRETLHQVIQHYGLEACVPLVAAATPQQVRAVLDLDLWRQAAAGGTEQFDAERFGGWLEALMEEGERVAARVIAEMDEGLAIAALSRYVRVFDPGVFEPTFSTDDEREWDGPRLSDDCEAEVGGYRICARTADAWDAIVGLLVALSEERPDTFHSLMRGCRELSNSTPEEGGLDDLLLAPHQAMHDVSLEREQRRAEQGYLSPEDARAFLQTARLPKRDDVETAVNPVARAYFRDLEEIQRASSEADTSQEDARATARDVELVTSLNAVAEVMAEAGVATAQPRALLGPATAETGRLMPLASLMEFVLASDPAAYFARNQELTFLANALMAGSSVYTRPFAVHEAWDAAVGMCNLGLDRGFVPDALLVEHDLIAEFEAGWRLLHENVSLFIADRLIAALDEIRTVDDEVQRDLDRLRRDLRRERDAGTPWRAAESLEVMSILDTPAWACLFGLLSECPVVPDALAAILDGRRSAVSATRFRCFTTRAQLDRVREFGERLIDLLR